MGRSPCRDVNGLKKGPWTSEEDERLVSYINRHGHSSWRALPKLAGLNRCGKSCRLRWTNYLRPDIKRGKFTTEEEEIIINLHAVLGNKWSAIATNLPGRTDNEIKNFWNTHLRKKLFQMGIDPITHRPRIDQLCLLENLPQLLASFTNPRSQWDNVMSNDQIHNVTQIAKFQLLQNILQVLSSSPPSTMLALDLLGAFPIIDHQNQQICEHNFRNIMDYPQLEGLGSSSINLRHDSQTISILSNLNSHRTATDLNVQSMSNSNLVLNGSQINDSYNQFITNLSVPWLVSSSPSPTSSVVNQIENKNYPKGDELSNPSSTTSTALEANWGELMGDEADDSYWKEIIGQATSSSWHCS